MQGDNRIFWAFLAQFLAVPCAEHFKYNREPVGFTGASQ